MVRKKKLKFDFTPSEYQEKIFDFIVNGEGNAVISAYAGAGKSFTILNAMKLIPSKEKAIFIAFNKSIADELNEKLKSQPNASACTSHSLGYKMIRRNLGSNITIDEYKYRSYVKNNIVELSGFEDGEVNINKNQTVEYIDNITHLIDYSRLFLCNTAEDIDNIAKRYDIPIIANECEVTLKCLEWGKNNTSSIDYADMLWLPTALDLQPMGMMYDWVFVDEAQDSSKATISLFKKCVKENGRWICVGDEKQCQPYGTKILMCDGSEKNIEDIEIGDNVVTYQRHDKCHFKHYKVKKYVADMYASKVTAKECHLANKIITLTTESGIKTSYTHDHTCFVKFDKRAIGTYIVYLMCNENGMFRIGTSQFQKKKTKRLGLRNRVAAEDCTKAWILKICETEHEARKYETIYSYKYGIPQIIFNHKRVDSKYWTNEEINEIFEQIKDISNRAAQCLNDLNLDIRYPFLVRGDRNNNATTYMFSCKACNIKAQYMCVKVFDEDTVQVRLHGYGKRPNKVITGKWEAITNIEYINEPTMVVSMNIEKDHNYVGDKILTHNCINLFAGSNEENFNQLCQEPNTQVFKLPISYRCGRQIIKVAQSVVPDILPKSDAIDGEVRENCHLRDLKDGDMVLARSKAPLLTIYSKLIKKGINCYIKGIDIGTNLIGLLDEVKGTKLNKSLSEDGVFVQLYDRLFNERNKLVLNRGLDIDDATLSSYILEKYDIIKALEIIAYDVKTKSELKNKIREIFKGDSKGVCISTIHKSKGLEADNVYIVCHSSMPSKNCHHEWEKIQEKNLVYVAYTRAKKVLGFISEKEIPPSGSTSDSESILNELNNIENIVCGLLGKPTFNGTNSVEVAKARIKKIEKVEIPKKKTKKKIRSVANKKDSNIKLLSDLDSLI